jgi:hypothetical protein
MNQSDLATFWPWYLHSARKDGQPVHPARRLLNILITCGILVAWYAWTSHADPFVAITMRRVAIAHPVFATGIVLASVLMAFRGIALDFMAYRIYVAANVQVRRHIFSSERKLHLEYKRIFGKEDTYHRVPEVLGALSIAIFIISSFAMVFSSR